MDQEKEGTHLLRKFIGKADVVGLEILGVGGVGVGQDCDGREGELVGLSGEGVANTGLRQMRLTDHRVRLSGGREGVVVDASDARAQRYAQHTRKYIVQKWYGSMRSM
jgi:hypothetical protein